MSDPNEFLKAINILTEQYKEDKNYKDDLYNEVERLLKENKEKDQIIEQQRKKIEALKQKGKTRYIEIEDKDRIIIYDIRDDKFTWRTRWSELPCNIIDDLYKNELMNYYKTNVLKVVRRGELTSKRDWYDKEFYSTHDRNKYGINTEFSVPLLKQIQNVRGELRNLANKNYLRIDKSFDIRNYLINDNYDDRCIGYTKNGDRCKCRGSGWISSHLKREDIAIMLYLRVYKNLPDMYICRRHQKTLEKDYTELMVWISTFLEIHYGVILENDKEYMMKKLFLDLPYEEWDNINIQ